ncbi:MAG: hypothetical protein FJZ64_02790 [Chlamydiae bacterium]|nr:hypothetical protein [Chlamydiota bacterium]
MPFDREIVLDFEDTLQDLLFPENTARIKNQGRLFFLELAKIAPELFKNHRIGIRINSLKSSEFKHDLKCLVELSKKVPLGCIIGPKTESSADVQRYLFHLKESRVQYREFLPIVETRKGVSKLSSIAKTIKENGLKYIIYGHADYSLGAGHWPFFEQNQLEFWEIVSPFIQTLEQAGIQYIHTPIFDFTNQNFIEQIIGKLQSVCQKPFGMIALNAMQAAICDLIRKSKTKIKEKPFDSFDPIDPISSALFVKTTIEKTYRRKKGFAIPTLNGKFIAPHMYEAAIRFLVEKKTLETSK